MYENKTYENILSSALTHIKNLDASIDIREGSPVWYGVAPIAAELAQTYIDIDNARAETFMETATRDGKLSKCEDIGIDTTQFESTNGEFIMVIATDDKDFNYDQLVGSRWLCSNYVFKVTKYLESNSYNVVCETVGSAPNTVVGDATLVDSPNSIDSSGISAYITTNIKLGTNEKSDEYIVETYYAYVKDEFRDGNVKQYEEWAKQFGGIGNIKVESLWNGANTVKVSILDSNNGIIDTSQIDNLVDRFQEQLDPPTATIDDNKSAKNYPQGRGLGNGNAPIGAIVTVTTGTEKSINISANITLTTVGASTQEIDDAIANYFKTIAYTKSVVSYLAIGAIISECNVVDSVSNLVVNGGTTDIALTAYEIPKLGTTTWTEV